MNTAMLTEAARICGLSIPSLYLAEKIELQSVFASGLVNRAQRKYKVTYWDDEQNTYKTGVFYMPDVDYKIINVDEETKNILYNKMRFALIEY